ncbi:MAG TPA: DoxX family protein [Urbifossiella sp.]|nr:DoxX family protein [Urbifossiella sp.]
MNFLCAAAPNWASSTGLLIVRVVVGLAFVLHGWPKILNATGWMNEMPNAAPAFLQVAAAAIEFGGGILLIAGLFARVVGVLLVAQMAVALALVHIPNGDPFVGKPGQPSAELPCAYLAIALLEAIIGPGLWSLDAMLFGPRTETAIECAFRSPVVGLLPAPVH